ncbi:hypothetical protein V3C99_014742, partial [Haemonchus contortus]
MDNVQIFRFTRVTFGLKPSPFLLAGTTYYHLDRHEDKDLVQEIKTNLYVDNLLFTCDTCEEARQFYIRSKAIFGELRMNLREFTSNKGEVMNSIPQVDRAKSHCPKVLGIEWNSRNDSLEMRCAIKESPTINKRTITSAIASIYDPLGWYIPLLHQAKIFLQSLWKDHYEWDASLTKEKAEEWTKISSDLKGFHKSIPRFLAPKKSAVKIAVFGDASTTGMSACAYLVHSGEVNLLMAKSKLPPLHGTSTIPKLEMNAITLAARLANAIATQLKTTLHIEEVYIFSDSEIALCWVRSPPNREVGIFVHNRLSEIRRIVTHLTQEVCPVQFEHVPSEQNPADCGTRGVTSTEFSQHYWWKRPTWLQEETTSWPTRHTIFGCDTYDEGEDPGDTTNVVAATGVMAYEPELLQSSHVRTFTQAKRFIAYALRFVRNTVAKLNERKITKIRITLPEIPLGVEPLSLCGTEVEFAGKVIIRAHQKLHVTSNIVRTLVDLNIRRDNEGILRCYGRLGRAQLDYEANYPVFVLQKTVLADIIVRDVHQKGHTGINHTELSTVVTEIESILNTRPLTYETTDLDRNQIIRPIDFLQRDLCLTYPMVPTVREQGDDDYITPEQKWAIQTKSQATAAVEASCKITEKFWNVWQQQYLTSLREKHMLNVGGKKGCAQQPQEGALVLICEATVPRYSWKVGIIQALTSNAQGTIREAVVRLPYQRLIRRPINLLVPLELEDDTNQEHHTKMKNRDGDSKEKRDCPAESKTEEEEEQSEEERIPGSRYNLRQRRNIDYNEDHSSYVGNLFSLSMFSMSMIILLLLCVFTTGAQENISISKRVVKCFQGGVRLESEEETPYEICGNQFCMMFNNPKTVENVTFPPEVVLYEYAVQWKFLQNHGPYTMAEETSFSKDMQFLSDIRKESISEQKLERNMAATLEEIHTQVKISKILEESHRHHLLQHTCTDDTGGELAVMAHRLLSTAIVTKGKLQSLTQRFILFDSIYIILTNDGQLKKRERLTWETGQKTKHDTNTTAVTSIVEKRLSILDTIIQDLEYDMERARKLISKEKIVLKGISFNNFNDSDYVNATLQRIEKHLEKIAMNANNTADVAPQMKRKPDEELKGNSPKVQILSDDDYMDRLIREDDWNDHQFATGERDEKSRCQQDIAMQKCTRKDDRNKDQSKTSNAEQSPQGKQERPTLNCTGPYDRSSPSPDYTGQYDRSNQSTVSRREQSPSREMKRLERDLYALREGLRRLPQRRIGERSRDAGVCAFCKVRNDHFSDSCPKCIEGDQRFKII